MEISDCTCVSQERLFEEPFVTIKKGLAAIPDTMEFFEKAPKPHCLYRAFLTVGLLFLHYLTWGIQLVSFAWEKIFGVAPEKALLTQLYKISCRKKTAAIEAFLQKHQKTNHNTAFLFQEFLTLPQIFGHLDEILRGANVRLVDGGKYFEKWSKHRDAYKRISSHNYVEDCCFGLGHIAFWLDKEGCTRFQLENAPFSGFCSTIQHAIDYLRYQRDNEQQGVAGASAHTEHFCLSFAI